MIRHLQNGTPVDVRDDLAFVEFPYAATSMRLGDEVMVLTTSGRRHHTILLRGPERTRYFVDVEQLKRYYHAKGDEVRENAVDRMAKTAAAGRMK